MHSIGQVKKTITSADRVKLSYTDCFEQKRCSRTVILYTVDNVVTTGGLGSPTGSASD